jgi:hypothetical protein
MRVQLLLLGVGAVLVGFGTSGNTAEVPAASAAPAVITATPAVPVAARDTSPADVRAELVKDALTELSVHVKKQSDKSALRSAVTAYYAFKAAHPEDVKKPYLYYIDYGLSGRTPRGYVFNMETLKLVEGPFTVAHGRGSGGKNTIPTSFSNRPGSAATSLGLYVTQETYGFSGKSGGVRYSSIGLRMSGESGRYNSNARRRGVVVHGAPYVTASGSGRSEGCPAMEQSRARRLLPMLAHGSVVFQFSPNDENWVANDPWLNAE